MLRSLIIVGYLIVGKYGQLVQRAFVTEVGATGYESELNPGLAAEFDLKPLNKFEKWLMKYEIAATREGWQAKVRQIMSR